MRRRGFRSSGGIRAGGRFSGVAILGGSGSGRSIDVVLKHSSGFGLNSMRKIAVPIRISTSANVIQNGGEVIWVVKKFVDPG